MVRYSLLVWLGLLAGCGDKGGDEPEGTEATDADGDGAAPPQDCDDSDAAIYPGAVEECDRRDNDCDGQVDEGLALDLYADEDGDGYGAGDAAPACEIREGWSDNADDCDDTAADVRPGGEELCDGLDNDCDGDADEDASDAPSWFPDVDGDGYGVEEGSGASCAGPAGYAPEGGDCDDADAAIYPGAPEVCDDGAVNDCAGALEDALAACPLQGELPLSGAYARLIGEESQDYAGKAVAGAGDWDGDGLADLLVGAYGADGETGRVYLVRGAVAAGDLDLSAAYTRILGEDAGDWAGWAVAGVGDVDGDGLADALAGGPEDEAAGTLAGAAWLLLGGASGDASLADAPAKLLGEGEYSYAGITVGRAGDWDGDGLPDLAIGASGEDEAGTYAGAAYVAAGTTRGTSGLGGAHLRLIGEADFDNAGYSLTSGGDADGDGLEDLLVGAPGSDRGAENGGAVYLVFGGIEGTLSLADVDLVLLGEARIDQAGSSVASVGDADGDGLADLLVGAYGQSDLAGAAYLVRGGVSGALSLADADARMLGEDGGDCAGRSVAGPGDADGDGLADLLVGASGADGYAGAAYLVLGGVAGTLDLSAADAIFRGEAFSDLAGVSVAGPGDADGDGRPDLLIGAYGHDVGGKAAGAAYVVGPRL